MMRPIRRFRQLALALAALATGSLAPAGLAAQLANPLPQAVGLGGNYTALARGFGAVSWNPAGLGMADNPRMSLAILPVSATAGLDPISPSDLALFDGQVIPYDTKVEWLDLIRQAGREAGSVGADVTYLGLSIGRFAIQASTNVRGRVDVAPDVAEILLFGNAGLTGDPRDYSFEGSGFDIAGTSTVAASLALPLSLRLGPLPDQRFSIGATVKYTIGNFLLLGTENRGLLGSDPVAVDLAFPVLSTNLPDDSIDFDPVESFNNGSGIGLDVGAAWQAGPFSVGVVVHDLVNTFEWDLSRLEYRAGSAFWNADTAYTSFEEAPLGEAPEHALDRIADLYGFTPVLSAGAAAELLPFLTVTGEVRHALEDNLQVGSRNHAGVGAELRIIPFLPLRAGVSLISGGYQLSGGAGLKLGPVQLSASGALRESDLGADAVVAAGLTFGL